MTRAVLVGLLLASLAQAQGPIEPKVTLDRLKTIARETRTKHKVPALAISVVTSKGIHALTWIGVRRNGSAVPVTADDVWHLGSDTKAFTAMLLAILAEQGKLDLDAKLPTVLPATIKVPDDYKEITVNQLLRHRSGMPANLKSWWDVPGTLKPREQRVQAVKRGLAMKPAVKPGEEYHYSNLGYVVAGTVAEKVGDATWEALLEKHVLKPLEMTTFGYGPQGTVGKTDQPLSHDKKGNPIEPILRSDNPPVMGPAGQLHLSLQDWSKFAQEHLRGAQGKGKLLKPEGYKHLHNPVKGETYTPGGWIHETSAGFPLLTHDGSHGGNYVSAAMMPTLDVAVLVVCNQGPKPGESACKEALIATIKAALAGK